MVETDLFFRDATIQFHVVSWDYAQTFPLDGDNPTNTDKQKEAEDGANAGDVDVSWEVRVEGQMVAHM